MGVYTYKPLEGLLELNKEDYKSVSLLKMLDKVEEDLSPSPKGRAQRLMLFFYLIDILQSNGIHFYVKGGIILQYYLGDHARATNDIDVLVPHADEFYSLAKKAFIANKYGLDIKVLRFTKREADENYYFSTFNMLLSIAKDGKEIDTIYLEGISGNLFFKIAPKEYQGPAIIKDNYMFFGVPIEYMFADKLLAVTSELKRPYKHLVDAYSISQINIDINELKKYLEIILAFENITREKLGISTHDYEYQIKKDKKFTHNYYFPLIQAGYTIPIDEMIQSLNHYMSTHLS